MLTPEAIQFTHDRHLAVLSTFDRSGGIHSVPVGFTVENDVVRIITSDQTQKVRNIERGGYAIVAQVDGARWISLAGQAEIVRDAPAVAHAVELYAARYRQPRPNPIRIVITFTIDRVMGSAGMRDSGAPRLIQ